MSIEGSHIPSGRQLPRTPLQDVRRRLEEPQQDSQADNNTDEKKTMGTSKTAGENAENSCKPMYSMLKGMKGYQLTPSDLEFIEKMKEEKLIRKLQEDLEKVQRDLKKEKLALNLVCASRDEAQAELNKFPSCEEISQWIMSVLKVTSPSVEVTGLDTRSLLAMVTEESVRRVMDKKGTELAQMENMLENKRKEEAQERGQLGKIIAAEQLKIQRMMHQLSDLTSELSQVESYDAILIKTSRGRKEAAEVGDTSEEQQGKRGQKERKNKKEKLQDTKTQSRSMRSKRVNSETGNQAGVKENHANKDANETLKTSTADKVTKSVQAKRPQRKVQEQEPRSHESAPVVRERRKTPAASHVTTAPQQKNQTKAKSNEAPSHSAGRAALAPRNDAEDSQSAGLRRSKRIASRR